MSATDKRALFSRESAQKNISASEKTAEEKNISESGDRDVQSAQNLLVEKKPCEKCRGEIFWESIYLDGELRCVKCIPPPSADFVARSTACGYRAAATKPTLVVHCKRSPHDVYIGRPSKWGNPFKKEPGQDAIAKYEAWIMQQPHLMAALPELRGKVLGCWCSPNPCHGDVLARLADGTTLADDAGDWGKGSGVRPGFAAGRSGRVDGPGESNHVEGDSRRPAESGAALLVADQVGDTDPGCGDPDCVECRQLRAERADRLAERDLDAADDPTSVFVRFATVDGGGGWARRGWNKPSAREFNQRLCVVAAVGADEAERIFDEMDRQVRKEIWPE